MAESVLSVSDMFEDSLVSTCMQTPILCLKTQCKPHACFLTLCFFKTVFLSGTQDNVGYAAIRNVLSCTIILPYYSTCALDVVYNESVYMMLVYVATTFTHPRHSHLRSWYMHHLFNVTLVRITCDIEIGFILVPAKLVESVFLGVPVGIMGVGVRVTGTI